MGAPDRTTGLPYHLIYPILSVVLLAIAAFASADSVWYVSVNTQTETIRFATQNYCGYNVSNLVITSKLGCVQRGWQWQLPSNYFGFQIPDDIASNLSKVTVTSVVAFSFVLAAGLHHAYSIRYSFRANPKPNGDKLYSLVQIHFITVGVCFLFTLIAFVAQAAVIGNATSYSGNIVNGDPTAISIQWGQSPWLVLAAGVIHIGWGYESVKWRTALLK